MLRCTMCVPVGHVRAPEQPEDGVDVPQRASRGLVRHVRGKLQRTPSAHRQWHSSVRRGRVSAHFGHH